MFSPCIISSLNESNVPRLKIDIYIYIYITILYNVQPLVSLLLGAPTYLNKSLYILKKMHPYVKKIEAWSLPPAIIDSWPFLKPLPVLNSNDDF